MKKTQTVQKQEVVAVWSCDLCGKEGHRNLRIKVCAGCGRDVCSECFWIQDEDAITGKQWEDGCLPDMFYICKHCYVFVKDFGVEGRKVIQECEEKLSKIKKDWMDKCKRMLQGCPKCGCADWSTGNHDGTTGGVPECTFKRCDDCGHKWGME